MTDTRTAEQWRKDKIMNRVTMSDLDKCETPEQEKRFWKQFEYHWPNSRTY